MRRLRRAAFVVLLAFFVVPVDALARREERFELSLGFEYDQGKFGTDERSRTMVAPFGLKYLGDTFDVGVSIAFEYLESEGGIELIEREPEVFEERRARGTSEFRVGDVDLKARYYLLDDGGPKSFVPSLSPFVKVGIPTRRSGEVDLGIGLEVDKDIGDRFFVFGDARYTLIWDPAGVERLDGRPSGSVGAGMELTRSVSTSAGVEWRQALAPGEQDAVEVFADLSFKLSRTVSLTPSVFVGLTTGAPDFGFGIDLSWKFGRIGPPRERRPPTDRAPERRRP